MSAHDHLSSEQFTRRYRPLDYADRWADVPHSQEWVGDKDLQQSVAEHGIQTPVSVHKGYVTEGHHRVVAAMRTGQPVPYVEPGHPQFEGAPLPDSVPAHEAPARPSLPTHEDDRGDWWSQLL